MSATDKQFWFPGLIARPGLENPVAAFAARNQRNFSRVPKLLTGIRPAGRPPSPRHPAAQSEKPKHEATTQAPSEYPDLGLFLWPERGTASLHRKERYLKQIRDLNRNFADTLDLGVGIIQRNLKPTKTEVQPM